ncbi:MAG: hypothetical protein ACE5ES_02785 [Candidatus Nanoarchaeia archaeon]
MKRKVIDGILEGMDIINIHLTMLRIFNFRTWENEEIPFYSTELNGLREPLDKYLHRPVTFIQNGSKSEPIIHQRLETSKPSGTFYTEISIHSPMIINGTGYE